MTKNLRAEKIEIVFVAPSPKLVAPEDAAPEKPETPAAPEVPEPSPVAPTINGCNFFSGVYNGGTGTIGFNTEVIDWAMMWQTLGMAPPGALPENTVAIMEASGSADAAIAYRPVAVTVTGEDIHIDWRREHVPHAENTGAVSQFAVLVLPKGSISAQFNNAFPEEEKRAAEALLKAEVAVFSSGLPAAVKPLKAMQFKPARFKP